MANSKKNKPTKYLNSNLDMFALSQQDMKIKGAKPNPRDKEAIAVNKALFIARTGRGDNTQLVKDILQRSADEKKVQAKDPIRFSGKYAYEYTFGDQESIREAILEELQKEDLTKTRKKKLRAQLREVENKIELSKKIKKDEDEKESK